MLYRNPKHPAIEYLDPLGTSTNEGQDLNCETAIVLLPCKLAKSLLKCFAGMVYTMANIFAQFTNAV